jgi:hypothetical protein
MTAISSVAVTDLDEERPFQRFLSISSVQFGHEAERVTAAKLSMWGFREVK